MHLGNLQGVPRGYPEEVYGDVFGGRGGFNACPESRLDLLPEAEAAAGNPSKACMLETFAPIVWICCTVSRRTSTPRMPPPNPTLMQPRAWLVLAAVLWVAAFVSPPCDAQPIKASQAAFFRDCQKAWGMTFPGWAVGADCSTAVGLTCDESGMITKIYLSKSALGGSIPDSISLLTSLTSLDVSGCELNGPIPAGIGNLTSLKYLALSANKLTKSIPAGFGNLISLTYL
ncbi:unnamed protein product [Closterium sp. NIES-53]